MKNRTYGFTIVELLVVIVIIGILASITIVSFNGISAKAKTAQAQSNADAIMKLAETYNVMTGHYPDLGYTFSNNTIANLPASINLLRAPESLNSTNGSNSILYRFDGNLGAATGGSIEYWDFQTNAVSTNVIHLGANSGLGARQLFDVKVLVVAGGAGGASSIGGGGGAGGVVYHSTYPLVAGSFPVTVGNGGGSNGAGQNSVFDAITAVGGGTGGQFMVVGNNGGSGGGGGGNSGGGSYTSGVATQTDSGGGIGYGHDGGSTGSTYRGVGGGGAGAMASGQNGGVGIDYSSVFGTGIGASGWVGGGGGGAGYCFMGTPFGSGGQGGGGAGVQSGAGNPAVANTGGGGGAGSGGTCPGAGGAGGSGLVVLSYPTGSIPTASGGTLSTFGVYDIRLFTASSGTFVAS